MSPTFRAAVVRTPGGPDAIELIELPVTAPGPGEVRVAVAAATVNPVDLSTVGGLFHQLGLIHQPDHVGIGWDFAGTVAAAGAGVDLPVGTRVAGVLTGFDRDLGAYAEQLVVPAAAVAPVPDALDLPTAATVGINGLAASQLAELLGDGPGRLLITGAAGTVGAYLVPGWSPAWPAPRTNPSSATSAPSSPPHPRRASTPWPTPPRWADPPSPWSGTAAPIWACAPAWRPRPNATSPSMWWRRAPTPHGSPNFSTPRPAASCPPACTPWSR